MLKTLALVLLLANALLLAALSGVFEPGTDPQREPQRLQRQHQAELVRILGPQAASAAVDAASAASHQAAAAASSALATVCLQAGPFSAADAVVAERSLQDAGLPAGSWQVQRQDDGGAYMVYMGRYADDATLQRKLAELRRLKLAGEALHTAATLQPGISLGQFNSLAEANAALAQMARRGLRTARVVTLRPAQNLTVLRLPAADAAQRARVAGLQLPNVAGFGLCAPVLASGAASAAAVPGSAAAPASATMPAAASVRASASAAGSAPVAAPVSAPKAAALSAPVAAPMATSVAASVVPTAAASTPAVATGVANTSTRAALARAASAAAAEAAASGSTGPSAGPKR